MLNKGEDVVQATTAEKRGNEATEISVQRIGFEIHTDERFWPFRFIEKKLTFSLSSSSEYASRCSYSRKSFSKRGFSFFFCTKRRRFRVKGHFSFSASNTIGVVARSYSFIRNERAHCVKYLPYDASLCIGLTFASCAINRRFCFFSQSLL